MQSFLVLSLFRLKKMKLLTQILPIRSCRVLLLSILGVRNCDMLLVRSYFERLPGGKHRSLAAPVLSSSMQCFRRFVIRLAF